MSKAALTRPQKFWETHAVPNVKKFRRDTADQCKAMNAALSAYHMHDYVWESYRTSAPAKVFEQAEQYKFRQYLIAHECPDFELIQDLATAHKHMKFRSKSRRIIASAQSMFLGSRGSDLWSALPSWLVTTQVLVVERRDGTQADFAPALENVVQMWERLIQDPGL